MASTTKTLATFQLKGGGTTADKIAEFLFWAAENLPEKILSFGQVAKIVFDLPKTPRDDAKEVDMIKGRLSAARNKLIDRYQRDLVTVAGVGCRCTINSADSLVNCVPKRARRLAAAYEGLKKSIQIIKEEGLLDENPDIAYLTEWLQDELKPFLKKLEAAKTPQLLTPPAPPATTTKTPEQKAS